MSVESELENTGIKSEKLVESSVAWDGSSLPPYPSTEPVLSIFKYTFPPHTVTNSHFHEIINCGVILSGTLTIVNENGESRDFHAGEAIVETCNTIHHGENRGDEDVVILMFYAGTSGISLSTPA